MNHSKLHLKAGVLVCFWLISVPELDAAVHKLIIEYQLQFKGQVKLECYFDISGDVPKKARVEIFIGDEKEPKTGELDAQGNFSFTINKPNEIRARVISLDHATEIKISKEELEKSFIEFIPSEKGKKKSQGPFIERALLGLGILFSFFAILFYWKRKSRGSGY